MTAQERSVSYQDGLLSKSDDYGILATIRLNPGRQRHIHHRRCNGLLVPGLTLIELLLALAAVALLVAIAYPSYLQYIERSRNAQAMADIAAIEQAIARYRIQSNGALPNSLSQIGKGELNDPWGNPYRYTRITSATPPGQLRKDKNLVPINTDYDLYSMGADGASRGPLTAKTSRDDIVRANNGDFVGLASDY